VPAALLALLSAASTPYFESSVSDERHAAWFLRVLLWAVVIFAGAMSGNPGVNKYGPPHRRRWNASSTWCRRAPTGWSRDGRFGESRMSL